MLKTKYYFKICFNILFIVVIKKPYEMKKYLTVQIVLVLSTYSYIYTINASVIVKVRSNKI